MPIRCFPLLLTVLVALLPRPAIADVDDTVNRLRGGDCGAGAQPLTRRPALDEAAGRLAGGEGLASAVPESGYRAARSASLYIRGRGDIGTVLAKRYCDRISDPELADIGFFQSGDETWIVLGQPLSHPEPGDEDTNADRVIELINVARSEPRICGRSEFARAGRLSRSTRLDLAAQAHARELAAGGYLGHEGPDGSRPADRVTATGYVWRAVGENVAAGPTDAGTVVEVWMASPGHCATLMNDGYSETGVAYAVDEARDGRTYWVQVFAAPK